MDFAHLIQFFGSQWEAPRLQFVGALFLCWSIIRMGGNKSVRVGSRRVYSKNMFNPNTVV